MCIRVNLHDSLDLSLLQNIVRVWITSRSNILPRFLSHRQFKAKCLRSRYINHWDSQTDNNHTLNVNYLSIPAKKLTHLCCMGNIYMYRKYISVPLKCNGLFSYSNPIHVESRFYTTVCVCVCVQVNVLEALAFSDTCNSLDRPLVFSLSHTHTHTLT